MNWKISVFALVLVLYFGGVDGSPARCTPAKERLRRALSRDMAKSRTRRSIEVPAKAHWQCKFSLHIPFETTKRLSSKIEISLPIKVNFPGYLFDEFGIAKLKGDYDYGDDNGLYERKDQFQYDDIDNSIHGKDNYPIIHKRSVNDEGIYSRASQKERIYFYKHIEGLLEKLRLPGRDCLERMLCEVAEEPLDNGLLGDWLNIFLTPSSAVKSQDHSNLLYEMAAYVKAETLGEEKGRCHLHYEVCPTSIFTLLPLVAEAMFGSAM